MNRTITLGQVLGAFITLIIAGITAWVTIKSEVARQAEQIENLRMNQIELKNDTKEIRSDIKEIKDLSNDIKVALERKADLRDVPRKN